MRFDGFRLSIIYIRIFDLRTVALSRQLWYPPDSIFDVAAADIVLLAIDPFIMIIIGPVPSFQFNTTNNNLLF